MIPRESTAECSLDPVDSRLYVLPRQTLGHGGLPGRCRTLKPAVTHSIYRWIGHHCEWLLPDSESNSPAHTGGGEQGAAPPLHFHLSWEL